MSARATIGLGANLGDASRTIGDALARLCDYGTVLCVSSIYRTAPWGVLDQPEFCNAVAVLRTDLDPQALLRACKAIERDLGRVPSVRYGPRAIDLDLLFYGDRRIDEPGLCVPHPRLFERAFVLVPLAEIDPGYASAAAALSPEDRASVRALEA